MKKARTILEAMKPGSARSQLKALGAADKAKRHAAFLATAETPIEKAVATDAVNSEQEPAQWVEQVATNGCSSGIVSHLVYHHETSAFYDQHKEAIWEWLSNEAEAQGETVMKLLASFGGADTVTDEPTFKTLLAWAAYEGAAYNLLTKSEEVTHRH